jgi:hypothetical protein
VRRFVNFCAGELENLCSGEKYRDNHLVRTRLKGLQLEEILSNLRSIKKNFVI